MSKTLTPTIDLETTIALPDRVADILTPKLRLTISEWATEAPFLILEKGAVKPGPYDLAMTPYMREPLDAAGDPDVRWMNWVFGPQSGKTKGIEVILAWYLRHRPTNWLYIRPTEPDVIEAFRDRFRPMLEANASDLVPTSGEWVVLSHNPRVELANAIVYGAMSTIPRTITSRTTLGIIYDETDTGGDSGNALGNVLDLADERQMAAAAGLSITIGCSSPKYETGSNWQAYDTRSDRRVLHEPCPECGGYQELTWERMTTEGGVKDPLEILEGRLARLICRHCGVEIPDRWQGWMADRCVWVPRGMRIDEPLPLDDDEIRDRRSMTITPHEERWAPPMVGNVPRNPHRGYRIWAANSKFEQRSWSHMMARWFDVSAQKDPERLQVFVNSWRVLPWNETGVAAADEDLIRQRRGTHPTGVIPAEAKVVIVAVDLQEDAIIYDAWAFGPPPAGGEAGSGRIWQIESGQLEVTGQDHRPALELLYERCFLRGWEIEGAAADGYRMRAYAMGVDTGNWTDEAYEFSRRRGVIALKGVDIADYRVNRSTVEGKINSDPIELYLVNGKAMKNRLQRLLKQPVQDDDRSGFWLSADATDAHVAELASEKLKPRRSNKRVLTWQPKSEGRPNHRLDIAAYILAVVEILEQKGEVTIGAMAAGDLPIGRFKPTATPAERSEITRSKKARRRRRRPRGSIQGMDGGSSPI